jgi:ribosomal protein S27E
MGPLYTRPVPPAAYRVALASRGGGAFTYTYSGPPGLGRGQLCAMRFRSRIEVGVVVGTDDAPPAGVELHPLCPLYCECTPGWGRLLLDLCELACAAPHELVPRLTPDGSATGLRLSLTLSDSAPLADIAADILALVGALPPQKRQALADEVTWTRCCTLAEQGTLRLELGFTGQPGVTSATPALARTYALSDSEAALLGLLGKGSRDWPGHYLAGLPAKPRLASFKKSKGDVAVAPAPDSARDAASSQLAWGKLPWPEAWDICQRWPAVRALALSRCQCTWPELRHSVGLLAELQAAVASGQHVLILAPQAWMLDRLWPELAPVAPWLIRHRSDSPPGIMTHLLYRLQQAGSQQLPLLIAGTEAAWRLTAYGKFDVAILIDPSHPQWQVEGAPALDPRPALLLGLATNVSELRVIELGLSAFDGATRGGVTVDAPFEPAVDDKANAPSPDAVHDANPLPLHLRQPHLRRLVYFNRLGASRGLVCAECQAAVGCPQCRGRAIHYSRRSKHYTCPDCGLTAADLRCPRCGLAALMAHLPGLEAVRVREGELLVAAGSARPGPEHHTVIGTAQLLEPISSFWPQQLVYVDADERDLPDSDARTALDMAARLASLYANAELQAVHIVSARLADRVAGRLDPDAIRAFASQEDGLHKLGGLPPYGCLYRLRCLAPQVAPLHAVRELLGGALSQHPGTALLRLGRPFMRLRRAELHGWLLNPQITWEQWQALRWEAVRAGASLGINPRRGPWL